MTSNRNGATAKTDTTALEASENRTIFTIQNSGTNVLGVVIGNTTFYLAPCTNQDDGTGGTYTDEHWDGAVTVTGASPRYNISEY